MLEGITVLNQEMIMTSPDWMHAVTAICLVGFLISGFVCMVSKANSCIGPIAGIFTVIFLLVLLFEPAFISDVPTGRYRYEVTIDGSVSFNDIYERYEIVEQRGEIWVLEEKENVSE